MALRIGHRIREHRVSRGWSQEQLAARSGLSRAAVSAIETGRVVPSVAAALVLARTFDRRVEDLFQVGARGRRDEPDWAWPAPADPAPFWRAAHGERLLAYPIEHTLVGTVPPDGVWRGGTCESRAQWAPEQTLVIAGCDPAVSLIAAALSQHAPALRVLPLTRSSRQALDLLARNLVHVAGIHLQDREAPNGNRRAVAEVVGEPCSLLRVSRWQEGLALHPGLGITSVKAALAAKLRWVGREPGSGARRCLDALLGDRSRRPQGYHRIAADHAGVVAAIRAGWAQAGICVRVAAYEGGLDFLTVHDEEYDLCYRSDQEDDPRIQALLRAVRSRPFIASLRDLPGYDTRATGDLQRTHRRQSPATASKPPGEP